MECRTLQFFSWLVDHKHVNSGVNLKCDQHGTVICAAERGDCCESVILIQIEDASDLFIVSSTRSTEV